MPSKESLYYADWFKKADEDLQRVQARLAEGDIEDGAFHLQQAVEKMLKGFLLRQGWGLKKIHDLEVLLDDAMKYETSLAEFRELTQQVTGYYLIERYPTFEQTPTQDEVIQAYRQAMLLAKRLRHAINQEIER